MKVSPEQLPVRLGSYPGGAAGRPVESKPRRQSARKACERTRRPQREVNPEQASKVELRTPTRLPFGEGRSAADKKPARASVAVRRGNGSGMRGRFPVQRGRSAPVRGGGPQHRYRRGPAQKSERLIVPLRPGNSGGGKGLRFRKFPRKTKEEGLTWA
jgi:hypothetical protein